jgi:hypothetical protein
MANEAAVSKESFVQVIEEAIPPALAGCEIGLAVEDGFEVTKWGDEKTCAILLLTKEDAKGSSFLSEFVNDSFGTTVAVTIDIVQNYPIILVPEGTWDTLYLKRVFAHEAVHVSRLKEGITSEDDIQEETIGYEAQFKLLEEQGFPEPLDGSDVYENALAFESELYKEWKEGNLYPYLQEIGYGGGR